MSYSSSVARVARPVTLCPSGYLWPLGEAVCALSMGPFCSIPGFCAHSDAHAGLCMRTPSSFSSSTLPRPLDRLSHNTRVFIPWASRHLPTGPAQIDTHTQTMFSILVYLGLSSTESHTRSVWFIFFVDLRPLEFVWISCVYLTNYPLV